MTTNETTRALHELKLPGMASCWNALEETHQLDKLTLREGMQQMLQNEADTRQSNRIQRLVKNSAIFFFNSSIVVNVFIVNLKSADAGFD